MVQFHCKENISPTFDASPDQSLILRNGKLRVASYYVDKSVDVCGSPDSERYKDFQFLRIRHPRE